MRSRVFLMIMLFTTYALTTRAHAEHVDLCTTELAEIFSDTHGESAEHSPASFEQKKEAFLSIYRAATEGLSIEELQGLKRQPFDFKDFKDATNLSRAGEKLTMLKERVLPSFSTEEQKKLLRAIQVLLSKRISHTQQSQETWNQKREKVNDPTLVQTIAGGNNHFRSVAYSPDGKHLASGSYFGEVYIWNSSDPTAKPSILQSNVGHALSVTFSPDGSRLASVSHANICIWDFTLSIPTSITLEGHNGRINSAVTFFANETQFASSEGVFGSVIRVWNLNKRKPTSIALRGHAFTVNSMVFSPDGKLLAAADDYGIIRIWNLSQSKPTSIILEGHVADRVNSIAFSPDSTLLASSDDGVIRVFDLTKQEPTSIILNGHTDTVNSIVFSPDGRFIASGSHDNTIRIWNLSKKTSITLEGHTSQVYSVTFSPDGKTLASTSMDNTIRLWPLRKILGLDPLEEDAP